MNNCIGSYCCRQCGTHGDSIEFARQFLNYSFQEATEVVSAGMTSKNVFPRMNKVYSYKIPILRNPPAEWIINATALVELAHKNLLYNEESLIYLESRGLPLDAIIRYKLGWIDNNLFLPRASWGLEEQLKQDGKPSSLWIPKGLLIPSIDPKNSVIRLKVRRSDWNKDDTLPKYAAISGSMNGMTIVGSPKCSIMIVVESELDAFAIDYSAGDIVCAVAVGSNIKNPDNITDYLARNATQLIICHDNDEAGEKMLTKWKGLYPRSRRCTTPYGKDIGEAIQKGLDVKSWFSSIII
jgi:DNA primase